MTAVVTRSPRYGASASDVRDLSAAWRLRDFALLGVLGAAAGALRMGAQGDGDAFWGARAGMDTLRHGLPRHDTYSWTARGTAWISNSWGWNVVLGAMYRAVGMAAFAVLSVLLGVALSLVVAVAGRRVGARPVPTAVVFAAVGVFALGGAPRATVITSLAGPLVLFPVAAAVGRDPRRSVLAVSAIAAIQTIWVNLHSGAVLGPVITASYGLGLVVAASSCDRRALFFRVTIVSAVSGLCCLLTPYGTTLITHAREVRAASVGIMEEWRHYSPSMLFTPAGSVGALAVALAIVHAARSRRFERVAVLVVLTVLTLDAVRFVAPLLVFVMIELAVGLGKVQVRPIIMRVVLGVLVCGLLGAAVKAAFTIGHYQEQRASERLVAEIPAGCRLLNDDVVGGAVILLRPDVPVWYDDRNDMYGRALALRALSVWRNDPGSIQLLDRLGVNCVLERKTDNLAKALARAPGWQVLDSDSARLLLVRR